jgi:ankyrin repeat protein
VYGGGCTTLLLAATSVWPERAGVQEALLRTLLDRGAARGDGIIDDCLANGRRNAAAFLAAHGAPLHFATAAALGRIDEVRRLLNQAFRYACMYGGPAIVELLLARGADVREPNRDGQTPLHCAVIGGQLETVKLLLQHDPPLEARNVYGGTVLGQACWSAAHDGDRASYAEMIELLIAAGAKVPPRHVPVTPEIDELLRRYGSEPEPSWRWTGE